MSVSILPNLGGPAGSQTSTWVRTNVYAADGLLATYDVDGQGQPALHFLLTDQVGTRRMQTNPAGTPESECQSLPYGDGLNCFAAPNAPGTADQANALYFTGKQRDAESGGGSAYSGNDYFGARYYASDAGRWMSPDWASVPLPVPYGAIRNPQTLNLYSYVQNNPLGSVDEDGHGGCDETPELCKAILDSITSGGSIAEGWGNRLAQIGNQISSGIDTAKKDLDTFNSVLGFGKTNCAGGGSCSNAFGQAAGAVVAAVASDGESEEGVVEKQLADASGKIDRIIARVTEEDLSAAEREANGGMRVAKPGGGEYSHERKLQEFANGLNNQAEHLERMVKRSGLSDSQIDRINSTIEKARGMITTIRDATGGSN